MIKASKMSQIVFGLFATLLCSLLLINLSWADDGEKKWEFLTGGVVYSSPAIGTDGTIYVGSGDGKLYAINPDGTKKWEFAICSGI